MELSLTPTAILPLFHSLRVNISVDMMMATLLYLTTTGRKTGLPREIEIWFVEANECFYILAEHGCKAHWVQNVLANPRVRVRVGDQEWDGVARVLNPNQDADAYSYARQLARKKYGWGEGLPVEIRRRCAEKF